MNETEEKSLGLAYALTFFIPGAGHIYIGRRDVGLNYVMAIACAYVASSMIVLFVPVSLAVWIVCLFKTMPRIGDDFDAMVGKKKEFFAK
jgi:hypothetical protein